MTSGYIDGEFHFPAISTATVESNMPSTRFAFLEGSISHRFFGIVWLIPKNMKSVLGMTADSTNISPCKICVHNTTSQCVNLSPCPAAILIAKSVFFDEETAALKIFLTSFKVRAVFIHITLSKNGRRNPCHMHLKTKLPRQTTHSLAYLQHSCPQRPWSFWSAPRIWCFQFRVHESRTYGLSAQSQGLFANGVPPKNRSLSLSA